MIGSFWNLCRACPSMPVDKYVSMARVHGAKTRGGAEGTPIKLPKLEPAMPRRKKYPDLAYRHHEFLVSDGPNSDYSSSDRARVSPICISPLISDLHVF
nr:unnamed protein product [Callosobruchus analis]